ncbi:MAG: hypothetical protein HY727_04440 [Candidatus Rokubacteria bacterium]|nr:hypothetical protein [Candidatus Rokubacteria bacterium]
MSAAVGSLDMVAEGLWRRMRDVAMAERGLERFAFAPETGDARSTGRLRDLAADPAALSVLARDVTLRALVAAADAVNYRLLLGLGRESVDLDGLSRALGLPPLAVTERINGLAQLGLAARDLERDGASETMAGRGLVALIEAISAGLGERCRAGLGTLP